MAVERLFVDTWAWLVLANDRDPAFGTVSRIRAGASGHKRHPQQVEEAGRHRGVMHV